MFGLVRPGKENDFASLVGQNADFLNRLAILSDAAELSLAKSRAALKHCFTPETPQVVLNLGDILFKDIPLPSVFFECIEKAEKIEIKQLTGTGLPFEIRILNSNRRGLKLIVSDNQSYITTWSQDNDLHNRFCQDMDPILNSPAAKRLVAALIVEKIAGQVPHYLDSSKS